MMWFRVAALWGCPVAEAKQRCSEEEFLHWCKLYEMEPWGCEAEDIRLALQTLNLVACQVKSPSGLKLKQFLPRWGAKAGQPQWKRDKAVMAGAMAHLRARQRENNGGKRGPTERQGNGQ